MKGEKSPVSIFAKKYRKNRYFKDVATNIRKVLRLKKHNHTKVVKKFGKACSYPGTFMGSVHAMITSNNYRSAIIKTIKAGNELATPKNRFANKEAPMPTSNKRREPKRVPALPATN